MTTSLDKNTTDRPNLSASSRRWGFPLSLPILLLLPISVGYALTLSWDGKPIEIDLEVGEELMIQFEGTVDLGVPADLTHDIRVQTIDSTAYLTAIRPFSQQRLLVRFRDDDAMMVLDLTAASTPIEISEIDIVTKADAVTEDEPSYGELIRFGAQQLYAPKRLQQSIDGLEIVARPDSVTRLIQNRELEIHPFQSWRTPQGIYLTVLVLVNPKEVAVELDPSLLRGQWLASCFHHHRLLPASTEANVTGLYLISDKPFHESMID